MQRQAIQPEGMAVLAAPYSPVIVSGDLVVTAGQVAFDAAGKLAAEDIEGQTRQAFDNLARCLEAAGCTLADVLKVNAYLADLGEFEVYNEVYRSYFEQPYPARTTVQAGLAPGLRVEIEAWARRPS